MSERYADAINEFWNRRQTGGEPAADDLEPVLAETIDRLHSLSLAPTPVSARERARQRVFDTSPTFEENTMTAIPVPIPLPVPNGRVVPERSSWFPDLGARRKRTRWALASFAAALVILLAGIGSYFTFFDTTEQPAVIPAVTQQSTPSTDVPMYRGNPGRTGEMPGPGPEGEPVELWTFQTGGPVNSAPAIVGNTLVVGSDDGNIYALDASTGSELWRVETGAPANSSPALADGVVYAGSGNGLLALDLESGEEIWQLSIVLFTSAPVFADGVVYIGSDDQNLYALDAATGDEIWQFPLGAPASRSAAIADGIIYIGSADGVLHAVSSETGEEVWRMNAGPDAVVFTTTVSNGVVYQATEAAVNVYYALDASTGEELWRLEDAAGLRLSAVSGDTAYIPSEAGDLFAVDVATREEHWSFQTGAIIGAAPAVAGDTVYVCSRNGICYALDAANGDELWRMQLDDSVEHGPVVAGGVAYAGTQSGTVYAIGGSASEGLVASPAEESEAGSVVSPPATPDEGSDAGEVGSPGAVLNTAAIEVVWETDGEESPLAEPLGMALDQAGNLHVVDSGSNQIHVFGPDGQFIESWGSPGTEPGQFQFRQGQTFSGNVDFDADGNIYVSDFTNNRIQKFDANRHFLMEWGEVGSENGQFQYPLGAVDRVNERVYVIDQDNHRVQVFDLNGNFLDKWGSSGTLNGQFTVPLGGLVSSEGSLYVSDLGGRIQVFDQNGTFLSAFGSEGTGQGEFRVIAEMAFDAEGNLFVADYVNGWIQVFRPDGAYIGTIDQIPGTEELVGPGGLAFDDEGFLYVGDVRTSRVLKLKLPPIE